MNRGTLTYLILEKRGAPQEKMRQTVAGPYNGGMSLDRNGNDVPPMIMQTTDQPERGAQDLRLRCSVGMGGRDGARVQEGSTAESEKLDDGDIYSR